MTQDPTLGLGPTRARDRSATLWTLLHLALWAALACGFALQWKPAMVVVLLASLANLTTYFLPLALTSLGLLATLPFAGRSVGLANLAICLAGATGLQIWGLRVFIDGAAAH